MCASETVSQPSEDLVRSSRQWFKGGHADKIRVCAGLQSLNLVSGDLLINFSSSFNLASGGLLTGGFILQKNSKV